MQKSVAAVSTKVDEISNVVEMPPGFLFVTFNGKKINVEITRLKAF
jgi:hypothetical protein